MPGRDDWEDLVAGPTQQPALPPPTTSNWDDLVNTQVPPRQLGTGTPSRTEAEGTAYFQNRFRDMSYPRRALAGAQNIVNAMPLVRNIPGISTAISPSYDVETLQNARPFASRYQSTVGHMTPYLAATTIFPPAFSTFPRNAIVSGGTEALDTALAGGDRSQIYSAGGRGVAGAAVPALFNRIITPRTAATRERIATPINEARERQTDINVDILRALHRMANGRNLTLEELDALTQNMRRQTAGSPTQYPPWQISPENQRRITDSLYGAGMGGIIGHFGFDAPIMGSMVGAAIPHVANMGINTVNRTLQRPTVRAITGTFDRYRQNEFWPPMSIENQALLNALGGPVSQELFLNPDTIPGRREPSITATGE